MQTTRNWVSGRVSAVISVLVLGVALMACEQGEKAPADVNRSEMGQKLLEAAVPGGDHVMGDPQAPLMVVEYASLTCSHCADFANNTFPDFKKEYIDTGKVYYVFRPFPFDPIASAGFMISACAGDERYFNFIDVLFENQAKWAFSQDPRAELLTFAKQGGFSEEKFDACLSDEKIFDPIQKTASVGAEQFEVRSTPTFFIGGEKVEGDRTWAEFEPMLKEKLGSGS